VSPLRLWLLWLLVHPLLLLTGRELRPWVDAVFVLLVIVFGIIRPIAHLLI
jgi:hypothetical protein